MLSSSPMPGYQRPSVDLRLSHRCYRLWKTVAAVAGARSGRAIELGQRKGRRGRWLHWENAIAAAAALNNGCV